MTRREQLARLTGRWRERHAARRLEREAQGKEREPADAERTRRARHAFPYRTVTAEAYVAAHGGAMTAYTYDDYTYDDPELQDWLDEVGRLLRAGPMAPRP
jgi:hypothetical protein